MAKRMAIVMAAGKGTRMESTLPKVLIHVCGRPMLEYVLDALQTAAVDQVVVVVGYQADLVRTTVGGRPGVEFALQAEQLGTGHAVMMCREQLAAHDGPVLVVAGDSPLMQPDSLRKLLAEFNSGRPACILGTGRKENPHGLGRVVRDSAGQFAKIVEEKDTTADEKKITEVNLSCYVFNSRDLLSALEKIRPDNAQGEFYLTDCPGVLKAAGKDVRALCVLQPCEALSINTPVELAAVEVEMKRLAR